MVLVKIYKNQKVGLYNIVLAFFLAISLSKKTG